MSSGRVQWVLGQVEKWNSADQKGFLSDVPEDFEFAPDPSFPDAGTYRGEEMRRWMREWVETWQNTRLEVLSIEERKGVVLMESRWHLTASDSDDQIPVSDFNLVVWFDPGDRPVRMRAFFDRERAVAAAEDSTG